MALDIGLTRPQTLAHFFAGPNEDALNHLRLWSQSGTRAPVPTYLWGENGCGKTHLLLAVRAELEAQGGRVGWLDPGADEVPPFDPGWCAILMDDVQAFGAHLQHTAFNWFVNALSPESGTPRWVLAAGAWPPADLPLREDLRTRLGWGHVYALQVLDESARRDVLRQEAGSRGMTLGEDVIRYMLNHFSRDLSSLMQLLDHLDHYALQTQRAVTIPLVRSMLENE